MSKSTSKDSVPSVNEVMSKLGLQARSAASSLALASSKQKQTALLAMANAIGNRLESILVANERDVDQAVQRGLGDSFIDRLKLDESRIGSMVEGVRAIASLPDPIGEVIASWDRPNGLRISRVRTPLGVIGVIFESRPNVTADAGALCLKAGNPVILRGGSDSFHSSREIHQCLVTGLLEADIPKHAIQIVPTTDRDAVGAMLGGLNGNIDVIVPRGGKGLVGRIQREARVPVFAHLEGRCHIYVDRSSEVGMASKVVTNAKMRRTGVCGAAETLLVDRSAAATHLEPILRELKNAGCEIRATEEVRKHFSDVVKATEEDWSTEYLAAVLSVRLVEGVVGAIEHIGQWSSHHTEAILAEDPTAVEKFMNEVDSAILLHNASTQFADGGEFGMGAEIGIATGKMHARGPVGVEQLTSFNYRVYGSGQIRM